jgi:hypothetical protein
MVPTTSVLMVDGLAHGRLLLNGDVVSSGGVLIGAWSRGAWRTEQSMGRADARSGKMERRRKGQWSPVSYPRKRSDRGDDAHGHDWCAWSSGPWASSNLRWADTVQVGWAH